MAAEEATPEPPARPASTRTYAHPPLVRRLANGGVAFGVVSFVLVVLFPLARPGELHWAVGLACLVFLAAVIWVGVGVSRRSHDTIEVTDEGLSRHSPGEASLFLAWDEVGGVESQNVMQRLVVCDRSGARSIVLEYHLERFGELRRIVLERAGRPQR